MATEKGVIVEYDFAAMDGAGLLFETAKRFLEELDHIPFDAAAEARYLAGGNYQGGLAEYFQVVKTKKTALRAARELDESFREALAVAIPTTVGSAFRNFVKTLTDRAVKVVIATRADLGRVREAFAPVLGERVVLHHEESVAYGTAKWDAWRRACVAARLRYFSTLAVTGSGYGVKAALRAGMASLAVVNDHVAYQDFSGVDEVVRELGAPAAKAALKILRVG